MWYVIMYLAAVVLANLSVAQWGPSVAIVNAFLYRPGPDCPRRICMINGTAVAWAEDGAHRFWFTLVLVPESGRRSNRLASFLAFAGASHNDTAVYHRPHHRPRWQKMNGEQSGERGRGQPHLPPPSLFGWRCYCPSLWASLWRKYLVGDLVMGHHSVWANGQQPFPRTNHETPSRQRPPRQQIRQPDVAQAAKVIAVQEAQIAALQAENERLIPGKQGADGRHHRRVASWTA